MCNLFTFLKDKIGWDKLREKIASLSHKQWMNWAKTILETENISKDRIERWELNYFRPYENLAESAKEIDRRYADRIIFLLKKELEAVH